MIKSRRYLNAVAGTILSGGLAWGASMMFLSTPHNGISIILLTLSIVGIIWAFTLHRSINTRGRKMIFYFGIGLIVIGAVMVITQLDFHRELASPNSTDNLISIRENGQSLISDINEFVADRNLTKPPVKSSLESDSFEDWKKSIEYSRQTDHLFVYKFRQRVVNFGYEMRKAEIISEDDLNHLLWVVQAETPVIQWALTTLEEYVSRIEVE
ncbi:hypothetical protein ACFLXU_03590 [Chloroflexota bacterium]